MRVHLTLVFFIAIIGSASAQCDDYIVQGSKVFHANEIRTAILTGGDMFWDLNDGRFQVPFRNDDSPTVFFAAAVWMGGYDDQGELLLSAQTYRGNQTSSQEYLPGPLTDQGVPFDIDCSHWDTIWSVNLDEILLHLDDYSDGSIDDPQKSIFGWPGAGNPFFESYNGFVLPALPQGYASFYDRNGNGIYDPDQGDYPLPAQADATQIPDQMTWNIFHDVFAHSVSGGAPTKLEVQQTTFAYYCGESSELRRTVLVDYKVVNRNISVIDSTLFGIWMDPDLGCYTDDAIGSDTANHAFFIYNIDSIDGTVGADCEFGIPTYAAVPPAVSGAFLNRPMSAFAYYHNNGVGTWPPGIIEPSRGSPLEYYRYLSGRWRDGTIMTVGGTGYSQDTGRTETTFAFFGDPTDTTSWSMINEDMTYGDRRFVASTQLGTMHPGDVEHVALAFAFHQDLDSSFLGNVKLMYSQLPEIKEQYDSGFAECLVGSIPCDDQCVWPGDANNDGIANHYDLLTMGLAHGQDGTQRNAPLSWAPHEADAWPGDLPSGLNLKYADANGDGRARIGSDQEILELYYGQTHDDYQATYTCVEGDALIVDGGFELQNPNSFASRTSIYLNANLVPELYGLAFTILYDTTFFDWPTYVAPRDPFGDGSLIYQALGGHIGQQGKGGKIDYAVTLNDHVNRVMTDDPLLLQFILHHNREDLVPGQPDTTEVCIANIHGILADGTEIPMGANTIQFIFLDETTATSQLTEPTIRVYPNPSTGSIMIESDAIDDGRYEIYSLVGELVRSGRLNREQTFVDLAPGVYVTSVTGANVHVVQSVVVIDP